MSNRQVPEPKKKGLHPLAWVAIGCAGVLVVSGVAAVLGGVFLFGKARNFVKEIEENPALASAKVIAAANPDIELVGHDDEKRTVTFRNLKTGEEFTFNYQDIQEGKFSFSSGGKTASIDLDGNEQGGGRMTVTTDEGTATFGAGAAVEPLPSWIPLYPGTEPQGTYSGNTPEMTGGAYTISTGDDLDAVLEFYARGLEQAGLEIKSRTVTDQGAVLLASSPDEARSSTVTVSVDGGRVQVMVNFSEKKP